MLRNFLFFPEEPFDDEDLDFDLDDEDFSVDGAEEEDGFVSVLVHKQLQYGFSIFKVSFKSNPN